MGHTFEITTELLQPVLARLLNDETAQPKNFDLIALKPGAGNPTSLGVYRVSGQAHLAGETCDFSLVVKHLANGLPMMDASQENYWNYWRREMVFFESPIAQRIPTSIGYPTYLGQSDLPDGSALFWNSDLGDLTKTEWTWAQCLNAARLVAELNSIDSSDLDQYKWLNRNQPDGWHDFYVAWGAPDPREALFDNAATQSEGAGLLEISKPYILNHDLIKGILYSGRHTFVHGDFNLNNLVPVTDGEVTLIALDWQLAGVARIGTELAAIYNVAIEHGVCPVDEAKFNQLCLTYTERFNQLNPCDPASLDEVRLAAAAMGYFIIEGMAMFWQNPTPEDSPEVASQKIAELYKIFTTTPIHLYAKVLTELL